MHRNVIKWKFDVQSTFCETNQLIEQTQALYTQTLSQFLENLYNVQLFLFYFLLNKFLYVKSDFRVLLNSYQITDKPPSLKTTRVTIDWISIIGIIWCSVSQYNRSFIAGGLDHSVRTMRQGQGLCIETCRSRLLCFSCTNICKKKQKKNTEVF